jgi:GntR family transcriptional regulator, transcriptional repressor for pyruvate dehydrogenase complex
MAIDYGTLTTETAPSQISKVIRTSIIEGRLAVNERLPTESELAARFGVSRPTIREALKRLAAQNLIRSRRGPTGGNFVNGPSLKDAQENLAATTRMLVSVGRLTISEITEARLQLESVCLGMAAARRNDEHLKGLEQELEIQRRLDLSDVDFCASDVRFHRTLVDASGNFLLQFLVTAVVESLQPVANLIVFRFRDRKEIVGHHQGILEHLMRRDAEGAVRTLEEQMAYLRKMYVQAEAAQEEKRLARSGD